MSSPKPDINSYASATIRIRLPEGLILQGEFNAGWRTSLLPTTLIQGGHERCLFVKVCSGKQAAGLIGTPVSACHLGRVSMPNFSAP